MNNIDPSRLQFEQGTCIHCPHITKFCSCITKEMSVILKTQLCYRNTEKYYFRYGRTSAEYYVPPFVTRLFYLLNKATFCIFHENGNKTCQTKESRLINHLSPVQWHEIR